MKQELFVQMRQIRKSLCFIKGSFSSSFAEMVASKAKPG